MPRISSFYVTPGRIRRLNRDDRERPGNRLYFRLMRSQWLRISNRCRSHLD